MPENAGDSLLFGRQTCVSTAPGVAAARAREVFRGPGTLSFLRQSGTDYLDIKYPHHHFSEDVAKQGTPPPPPPPPPPPDSILNPSRPVPGCRP
jgi:hypothetical protein